MNDAYKYKAGVAFIESTIFRFYEKCIFFIKQPNEK